MGTSPDLRQPGLNHPIGSIASNYTDEIPENWQKNKYFHLM
jgi:hypothetical protein